MRDRRTVRFVGLCALLLTGACGGDLTESGNPDPVLVALVPTVLPAQAASATLEIHGQAFSRSSRVEYGGLSYTPHYMSPTMLELTLNREEMLAPPGTEVLVRVLTPAPGGGFSSGLSVSRDFGVPAVSTSSSLSLLRGDTLRTYTITGDNFTPHSTAYVWSEPAETNPGAYSYHQAAVVSAGKQTLVFRMRGWNPTYFGPYYLHVMNPDSVRSNSVLLH